MTTLNTPADSFYSELPTEAEILSLIKGFDESNKLASEAETYRMENYYNCVDDYSWGGICDQASDKFRSIRNYNKMVLLKQLETGVKTEIFTSQILCYLDGTIASERLVNGKFGQCWIVGTGDDVSFLGVSKKAATYAKKGFKVMTKEYKTEYYFLTKVDKNGSLRLKTRILSIELVDKFSDSPTTHLPREVYFAQNN